jgi:hypothetical protein
MLTKSFVTSLTEEEQSILYLITYNTFYRMCNLEPDFKYVHFLRTGPTIQILEKLKTKIKPENLSILESLKNKLLEYK